MRLSSHPRYRYLTWVAYWKIYRAHHARGLWFPTVPLCLAFALSIKAMSAAPFADYLIFLSVSLYVFEQPLLIARTRRAARQRIGEMRISKQAIDHIEEGLTLSGYAIPVTRDMSYRDCIVCSIIGDLEKTNPKETV